MKCRINLVMDSYITEILAENKRDELGEGGRKLEGPKIKGVEN